MARDKRIEHLLRRAAFGASPAELAYFVDLGFDRCVDFLVNFPDEPDKLDLYIGAPGYVGVTVRGEFSPNTILNDARQRWLFRMTHSLRPLQEKMALFWHNHFATSYRKISGLVGVGDGTRVMAANPETDAGRLKGQIELFREHALGNFRDLLLATARDPAMLIWLDGRTNVRAAPQENFGRELLELFTMGIGHYTEQDVYAAARVFTGWNLFTQRQNPADPPSATPFEFRYNAAQHDPTAKTFTFPIYPNGGNTIPARSPADGVNDGIDLINAVARHPATGPRLARKLYAFFVSEINPPSQAFIDSLAQTYYATNYSIKAVVRQILMSAEFSDPSNYFSRYAWPAEYVVRAIREVGWNGYSLNETTGALTGMGQLLFEPPTVAGWELGSGWISGGTMLARMNFAARLAANQRTNLRDAVRSVGSSAESTLSFFLDRLHTADLDEPTYGELVNYLHAGGRWTGSDAQLQTKASGLVHLIMGTAEYQFN
jgi:uncharacterized protein (DUF1800 family)